jgi:hypothetical protein
MIQYYLCKINRLNVIFVNKKFVRQRPYLKHHLSKHPDVVDEIINNEKDNN